MTRRTGPPYLAMSLEAAAWALLVTVLLAVEPSRASAQVPLEVEPAVGIYAGFGSFTKPRTGTFFDAPEQLSQRTSVALGGQVTAWLGPHVGARLFLSTAASAVGPDSRDLLNREPVGARVTVIGLEALAPLRSVSTGGRVFLAGGADVIHRSGKAYDGFTGTTDLGGSLGLGSQFRLTDRISMQGDLRAALYQLSLTDPSGLPYSSAFQTDLLAHVGVTVKLAPSLEE